MMHSCIGALITAQKHHKRLVDHEFSHAIIISTFECSEMPNSLWHRYTVCARLHYKCNVARSKRGASLVSFRRFPSKDFLVKKYLAH